MPLKLSDILTPATGKKCVCEHYWLINDSLNIISDKNDYPYMYLRKEDISEDILQSFNATALFIPAAYVYF